jgi:hypothetical protein
VSAVVGFMLGLLTPFLYRPSGRPSATVFVLAGLVGATIVFSIYVPWMLHDSWCRWVEKTGKFQFAATPSQRWQNGFAWLVVLGVAHAGGTMVILGMLMEKLLPDR